MGQQHAATYGIRRAGQLFGLLLVAVVLAFLLLSPVRAQETVVRIEIDAPVEGVPSGDEFEAQVLVENVEHLASFSFAIEYDPALVSFERIEDLAQFLTTGGRQEKVCGDPVDQDNTVAVSCVTTEAPVCFGGQPGASGSGPLGRVVFKSRGGGLTTLRLTESTLVLDDVEPCDPDFTVQPISHSRQEDASVELTGGGGGISGLIIGLSIGLVVVVVVGGTAGLLWYQRRGARTTP